MSMYHEKENDHRSGGNGKKELGSGHCRGSSSRVRESREREGGDAPDVDSMNTFFLVPGGSTP